MTELVRVDWEYCHIHHRHEPSLPGDYRACFECGHVYRTVWDLLMAETELLREMAMYHGIAIVRTQGDPERIFSCPLCTHDF